MRVTRPAVGDRAPRPPENSDAAKNNTRWGFHEEADGSKERKAFGSKPSSSAGEERRVNDLGASILPHRDSSLGRRANALIPLHGDNLGAPKFPPHEDSSKGYAASSNTRVLLLRRRRRASPRARISVVFFVGVVHLALGLLFAARLPPVEGVGGGRGYGVGNGGFRDSSGGGGRGGGGGGSGGRSNGEWQHPSSRPRSNTDNPWAGGNPWASGGCSAESVRSGGGGRAGRREEGGGGGRRGGRGAGTPEAEEARGWSERKRSESMRDIIEARIV